MFVLAQLPVLSVGTLLSDREIGPARARFTASLRVQRSSVLRMPFDIRFEGPKNVMNYLGPLAEEKGRQWRSDSVSELRFSGTHTCNTQSQFSGELIPVFPGLPGQRKNTRGGLEKELLKPFYSAKNYKFYLSRKINFCTPPIWTQIEWMFSRAWFGYYFSLSSYFSRYYGHDVGSVLDRVRSSLIVPLSARSIH